MAHVSVITGAAWYIKDFPEPLGNETEKAATEKLQQLKCSGNLHDQAEAEATTQNLRRTKNTHNQRTAQTHSVLCQHPCLRPIGSPS